MSWVVRIAGGMCERLCSLVLLVGCLLGTPLSHAGSFIFAGEVIGLDTVTHPAGYTGDGALVYLTVCVGGSAADSTDLAVPVMNAVKEFNLLQDASPNLLFGAQNDIPAGAIDLESLILHELGHCIGLGHPNLGIQSDVSGQDTEFTASGDGQDNQFQFGDGNDGVIGSADDQRGDDQNLHWFEIGVNDPFLPVQSPSSVTYSRDLADLPPGDAYPVNAGRLVGAALGYTDTEAVMQQGQGIDEDQRALQADDIATLRMGMTGLDRVAGTLDDYTFRLVYGGIRQDTSSCDVVIDSQASGFGLCFFEGQFLSAGHVAITAATILYNPDYNWHFNPTPNPGCSAANDQLLFSNATEAGTAYHEACSSIVYDSGYVIEAGTEVTAIAPIVSLRAGTRINGAFRVMSVVP